MEDSNLQLQMDLVIQSILAIGIIITIIITFYYSRVSQQQTKESLLMTKAEIDATVRSNLTVNYKGSLPLEKIANGAVIQFYPLLENIGDIPAYDIYYSGMIWSENIEPRSALKEYLEILKKGINFKHLEISLDPKQKVSEKIILDFHTNRKESYTIIVHLQYSDSIKNNREKIIVYSTNIDNSKNDVFTTFNEAIIERYKK